MHSAVVAVPLLPAVLILLNSCTADAARNELILERIAVLENIEVKGRHLVIYDDVDNDACVDAIVSDAAILDFLSSELPERTRIRFRLKRIYGSDLPEIVPPTFYDGEDGRIISSSAGIKLKGEQSFLQCQGRRVDDFNVFEVVEAGAI